MAFVLLLILSICTLVQVEQASSSTSLRRLKSEQAALLSLNIAIGKLQETAGLDQRVTAPAEAVAEVNGPKQLIGVWRSWEGRDHQATGLPTTPSYASKLISGDYEINAPSSGAGRFLNWLVSSAYDPASTFSATSLPSLTEVVGTTIPLVSEGSVGADNDVEEVHLEPTLIEDGGVAIAWWISGENTKALIKVGADPTTNAGWSQRLASNGRSDPAIFGLLDDDALGKATTLSTLDMASIDGSPVTQDFFHDMTSYSRGLLTNTANGGWRRDLSLMAEKWAEQWSSPANGGIAVNNISGFDLGDVFTVEPGEQISADLRIDASGASASIYPWATTATTSMSWNALAEYVSLYKRVQTNAGGMPYFDVFINPDDNSDRLTIMPIMARTHWTFGFDASIDTTSGEYVPGLAFKPSMTMWNPYNVAIEAPVNVEAAMARYEESDSHTYFPVEFTFKIGEGLTAKSYTPDLGVLIGNNNAGVRNSRQLAEMRDSNDQTFQPGESKVFGTDGTSFVNAGNSAVHYMQPGLNTLGGKTRNIAAQAVNPPSSDLNGFETESYTVDWSWKEFNGNIDTYINYRPNRSELYGGSKNFTVQFSALMSAVDVPALPVIQNVDETLGSAYAGETPFANVLFTLRLLDESNFPTKGYVNTKPIASVTHGTLGDTNFNQSSYEWVMSSSSTWDGPGTPDSDPTGAFGNDHAGYLGTSYSSNNNGISRWAVAELPTQPLLSLGELQHFDPAYNNPIAPRVANAIGNSHATPDIASAQLVRAVAAGTSYDHSYVANHLLFDDWFVSSIAPDVVSYSESVERDMRTVYADHISGVETLRNQHYKPADTVDSDEASAIASTFLAEEDAWRDVASELEVEGMFNINSTSTKAWEALLRSQREASIPKVIYEADQNSTPDSWSIQSIASSSTTPFSRTTVTGDPETDSLAGDLVTKYPEFTDLQIQTLAEQIVEQVKLRGPFLSLSEFVNRQLSSDVDLALAGTIEAALIEMSEMNDARDPFNAIEAEFPQQAVASSSALFTEAAEGSVAYGTPGWVRQADILRPLAPIMSARDDTFVIRAYGESKNSVTGEAQSSSWCEAVVQRRAAYVDTSDEATVLPSDSTLSSDINKRFGRRFSIVSFRWLSPDEV